MLNTVFLGRGSAVGVVGTVAQVRDSTMRFFNQIAMTRHAMVSRQLSATIRIDLDDCGAIDLWFIQVDGGLVRVLREDRPADCVIHAEAGLFDRFASGEANLMAAVLRNEVSVSGDISLLTVVRKLFPGPPGAHDSRVSGK